ncbi:MAG TPA: hypothetical protein VFN82_03415 [Solirubrobacterales bacterium]|nr:hypothetical protein [Solirubrobacterales bacterium]
MLGPGRYLLGVLEILLVGGFAWLGGAALRRWLLPRFEGAPAHLASAVVALALLIWPAVLLGSFGAFYPLPYLLLVAAVGLGCWKFAPRLPERGDSHLYLLSKVRIPSLRRDGRDWGTAIALLIVALAVIHFAGGVKTRLSTGMTGFDSTWYHGPFAAGFFQSGDTWNLHFIAPQFLAWFYPANGEIFPAAGMLAFSRDILSPLLNLGWFGGCLAACWCIGRPYRVAPWSLALGAIALSVPALADQAGEARNDIAGIFFLLAAVAIALNAWKVERAQAEEGLGREEVAGVGAFLVAGLAAGLAAGTKLNFLLPAAVFVLGIAFVAPREARWRGLGVACLAALAGGGYWYLRNLAHAGNPLPWVHHLGPIDLPAPEQALGGREAHSVLSYLSNGSVWSTWFLPGLHGGLWLLWPLLVAAAAAGLVFCLVRGTPAQRVAALVGIASGLAWLTAPTSASGPEGMPRGFESGLRYLAPALVLGLTLLPTGVRLPFVPDSGEKDRRTFAIRPIWMLVTVLVLAVAAGYPIQRHYLAGRYEAPTFTTPGLNAAFAWSRDVSGSRIATTSTRQYPLYGTDLSNEVQYLGMHRPHGGFEAPTTCRQYLQLLEEGNYDYAVVTKDRLESGKPPYPPLVGWLQHAGARTILKTPPTVVFKLPKTLDPSACR